MQKLNELSSSARGVSVVDSLGVGSQYYTGMLDDFVVLEISAAVVSNSGLCRSEEEYEQPGVESEAYSMNVVLSDRKLPRGLLGETRSA